jgi:hypothetical protein
MATIGREGCTGVQAIFGAKSSYVRHLVQIPGDAAKMSRAAFTRAMGSMTSFRLECAGLIARGRRQITILDRQGLVGASCEYYQLVRARVAFHLPKTTTVRLCIEQIQLVIWRRIVVVVVNVLKGAEKLDFLERVDG